MYGGQLWGVVPVGNCDYTPDTSHTVYLFELSIIEVTRNIIQHFTIILQFYLRDCAAILGALVADTNYVL